MLLVVLPPQVWARASVGVAVIVSGEGRGRSTFFCSASKLLNYHEKRMYEVAAVELTVDLLNRHCVEVDLPTFLM